jgi:DnaJ-class molecular chaperone
MPIDVNSFSKKLYELESTKRTITNTYNFKMQEINNQIAEEKAHLERINEILKPYICPNCQGSGDKNFYDAAGSKDYEQCSKCKGSGII